MLKWWTGNSSGIVETRRFVLNCGGHLQWILVNGIGDVISESRLGATKQLRTEHLVSTTTKYHGPSARKVLHFNLSAIYANILMQISLLKQAQFLMLLKKDENQAYHLDLNYISVYKPYYYYYYSHLWYQ